MSPYGWTQLARSPCSAPSSRPRRAKVVEHLRGFEPKVAEALTRELKLDAEARWSHSEPKSPGGRAGAHGTKKKETIHHADH